ncbi:MAG: OmpA family protein [Kofleriaceae bacterium]|nr:OmpA family protein [Kofleriaceae bacterium]
MTRSLLLYLAIACTACAGQAVRTQTAATDGLIITARENGAQRCAPVELAMAESNNDFAQHALDEGNFYDAKRTAEVAETNAKLAIEKSPKDKCTDQPKLPPKPQDRDGDGLLDPDDKCPDDPEDFDKFQDDDGCPDLDNDADGIRDKDDKCPDNPEDIDKFEDTDGCPELDNDQDGLADTVDQCPNEAEDKDGFEDDDGCPDPDNDNDTFLDNDDKCPLEFGVAPDGCPKKYVNVVVTKTKIEIKQTIFFEFNKATIKSVSFSLLNEVAQALADNPTIKVEIQGHTDSVGNDKFNLKLSQKRAESVKAYLAKRGIDAGRMDPKGYGENVPIADNRTADGRSQNRRVEFVITER